MIHRRLLVRWKIVFRRGYGLAKFPLEDLTAVFIEVRCIFGSCKGVNLINNMVRHRKLCEPVSMDAFAGIDAHKIITALAVRWA